MTFLSEALTTLKNSLNDIAEVKPLKRNIRVLSDKSLSTNSFWVPTTGLDKPADCATEEQEKQYTEGVIQALWNIADMTPTAKKGLISAKLNESNIKQCHTFLGQSEVPKIINEKTYRAGLALQSFMAAILANETEAFSFVPPGLQPEKAKLLNNIKIKKTLLDSRLKTYQLHASLDLRQLHEAFLRYNELNRSYPEEAKTFKQHIDNILEPIQRKEITSFNPIELKEFLELLNASKKEFLAAYENFVTFNNENNSAIEQLNRDYIVSHALLSSLEQDSFNVGTIQQEWKTLFNVTPDTLELTRINYAKSLVNSLYMQKTGTLLTSESKLKHIDGLVNQVKSQLVKAETSQTQDFFQSLILKLKTLIKIEIPISFSSAKEAESVLEQLKRHEAALESLGSALDFSSTPIDESIVVSEHSMAIYQEMITPLKTQLQSATQSVENKLKELTNEQIIQDYVENITKDSSVVFPFILKPEDIKVLDSEALANEKKNRLQQYLESFKDPKISEVEIKLLNSHLTSLTSLNSAIDFFGHYDLDLQSTKPSFFNKQIKELKETIENARNQLAIKPLIDDIKTTLNLFSDPTFDTSSEAKEVLDRLWESYRSLSSLDTAALHFNYEWTLDREPQYEAIFLELIKPVKSTLETVHIEEHKKLFKKLKREEALEKLPLFLQEISDFMNSLQIDSIRDSAELKAPIQQLSEYQSQLDQVLLRFKSSNPEAEYNEKFNNQIEPIQQQLIHKITSLKEALLLKETQELEYKINTYAQTVMTELQSIQIEKESIDAIQQDIQNLQDLERGLLSNHRNYETSFNQLAAVGISDLQGIYESEVTLQQVQQEIKQKQNRLQYLWIEEIENKLPELTQTEVFLSLPEFKKDNLSEIKTIYNQLIQFKNWIKEIAKDKNLDHINATLDNAYRRVFEVISLIDPDIRVDHQKSLNLKVNENYTLKNVQLRELNADIRGLQERLKEVTSAIDSHHTEHHEVINKLDNDMRANAEKIALIEVKISKRKQILEADKSKLLAYKEILDKGLGDKKFNIHANIPKEELSACLTKSDNTLIDRIYKEKDLGAKILDFFAHSKNDLLEELSISIQKQISAILSELDEFNKLSLNPDSASPAQQSFLAETIKEKHLFSTLTQTQKDLKEQYELELIKNINPLDQKVLALKNDLDELESKKILLELNHDQLLIEAYQFKLTCSYQDAEAKIFSLLDESQDNMPASPDERINYLNEKLAPWINENQLDKEMDYETLKKIDAGLINEKKTISQLKSLTIEDQEEMERLKSKYQELQSIFDIKLKKEAALYHPIAERMNAQVSYFQSIQLNDEAGILLESDQQNNEEALQSLLDRIVSLTSHTVAEINKGIYRNWTKFFPFDELERLEVSQVKIQKQLMDVKKNQLLQQIAILKADLPKNELEVIDEILTERTIKLAKEIEDYLQFILDFPNPATQEANSLWEDLVTTRTSIIKQLNKESLQLKRTSLMRIKNNLDLLFQEFLNAKPEDYQALSKKSARFVVIQATPAIEFFELHHDENMEELWLLCRQMVESLQPSYMNNLGIPLLRQLNKIQDQYQNFLNKFEGLTFSKNEHFLPGMDLVAELEQFEESSLLFSAFELSEGQGLNNLLIQEKRNLIQNLKNKLSPYIKMFTTELEDQRIYEEKQLSEQESIFKSTPEDSKQFAIICAIEKEVQALSEEAKPLSLSLSNVKEIELFEEKFKSFSHRPAFQYFYKKYQDFLIKPLENLETEKLKGIFAELNEIEQNDIIMSREKRLKSSRELLMNGYFKQDDSVTGIFDRYLEDRKKIHWFKDSIGRFLAFFHVTKREDLTAVVREQWITQLKNLCNIYVNEPSKGNYDVLYSKIQSFLIYSDPKEKGDHEQADSILFNRLSKFAESLEENWTHHQQTVKDSPEPENTQELEEVLAKLNRYALSSTSIRENLDNTHEDEAGPSSALEKSSISRILLKQSKLYSSDYDPLDVEKAVAPASTISI